MVRKIITPVESVQVATLRKSLNALIAKTQPGVFIAPRWRGKGEQMEGNWFLVRQGKIQRIGGVTIGQKTGLA